MGRKTPLNEKQLAVLNWVAEGRPKGVYEDGFEHRVTARALERRGLLSIRGHGPTWRATLTGDGRYYAKNGIYPPSAEPEKPQPPALSRHPRQPEPINDLLERLEASDGSIELEAPTTSERVRYRRAVERLRTSGGLGSDQRLRMTGTKRGPLRIQVLQVDPPAEP